MEAFFSTDTLILLRGIIPCLFIVFVGYWVGRVDRVEHEKTLSSLIHFVFSPCLIFTGLHRHAFRLSEVGALALAAVFGVLLLLPLALAVRKRQHPEEPGTVLPMLFASTGTLLLPLAYLLYGNEGLAKAAMFHLFSSFAFYTFGVWFLARHTEAWRFFRSPSVIAAAVALLSVELAIPLTPALDGFSHLLERGIAMVGIGAIPLLLLSFGYPFFRVSGRSLRKGLSGGLVRMLVGPLAALLIVLLLREIGFLTVTKAYSVLDFIDKRTTEAVIILACALPGAMSCYLLDKKLFPETAEDSLGMLLAGSLLGIITLPMTLIMINRFILAG